MTSAPGAGVIAGAGALDLIPARPVRQLHLAVSDPTALGWIDES